MPHIPRARIVALSTVAIVCLLLLWALAQRHAAPLAPVDTGHEVASADESPIASEPLPDNSPEPSAPTPTRDNTKPIALWAASPSTPATDLRDAPWDTTKGPVAFFDARTLAKLEDIPVGTEVALALTDGRNEVGLVSGVFRDPSGAIRIGGRIVGNAGASFSMGTGSGTFAAHVLIPAERLAFVISEPLDDLLLVHQRPINDVICFDMPRSDSGPETAAMEDYSDQTPVDQLSSRAGAVSVLYLDFDGQTVTGTNWNREHTDDAPINAAPSTLTEPEIRMVWKRVREDFLPFNVDVTTNESRYLIAPVGRRVRVVITPTKEWYNKPGSGGVAKTGSFTLAGVGDYDNDGVCWVFNGGVTGVAEAVSHELGHTLGLSHDGLDPHDPVRSADNGEYYLGHGPENSPVSWAPIMGIGYDRHLVQWSLADYPNAKPNYEDDLAIIAGQDPLPDFHGLGATFYNVTGFVSDEAGNDPSTAAAVDPSGGPVVVEGVITSASDSDFYTFVLAESNSIQIKVTPGVPSPKVPNLDVRLRIMDAGGTIIQMVNPQTSLDASTELPLAAGTHYVSIDGTSNPGGLESGDFGYSNYGSIGEYKLEILAGAPLIKVQPFATSTALLGGTIELSVVATGNPPLSYQWQYYLPEFSQWRDLSDYPDEVSGATTSNLRLSNLTDSWDGRQLRVVVGNAIDTVESTIALLQVRGPEPFTLWQMTGMPEGGGFGPAVYDADGNVWMAGNRINPVNGSGSSPAVWKLDSLTGKILLDTTHDPVGAPHTWWTDIGLDPQGDVIAIGSTFAQTEQGQLRLLCAAKFSRTNLQQIWRVTSPVEDGGFAVSGGVTRGVVTPQGDVLMTSTTVPGPPNYVYRGYVMKVNGSSGTIAWRKLLDDPECDAHEVISDADGNALFTGSSLGSTVKWMIRKLSSSSGSLAWARDFHGAAGGTDGVGPIAVDPDGNVIVTGTVSMAANINYPRKIRTAKYSGSGGSLMWERIFEHTGFKNDAVAGLAVRPDGDVVVTGTTEMPTTNYSTAMITIKYSGLDGSIDWTRTFRGPGSGAFGRSLAFDQEGDVIALGYFSKTEQYSTPSDAYIAKYSGETGSLTWEKRFDGPSNPWDEGVAVSPRDARSGMVIWSYGRLWVYTEDTLPAIQLHAALVEVDEGATANLTGDIQLGWHNGLTMGVNLGPVPPIWNATLGHLTLGPDSDDFAWTYFSQDGPLNQQVTITAADGLNPAITATFQLKVNNVAPSIDAGPDEMLPIGVNQFFRTSHIIDPGSTDTFSGTINFGDGAGTQTLPVNNGNRTYNSGHIFPGPGNYTVNITVNDDDGGSASDSFVVTVQALPPQITQQPQPETLTKKVGESATFTVGVSGTPPLLIQWRKNGVDIPGATGTSYTIDSIQLSDSAGYSVYVTGPGGNTASNVGQLTVQTPPAFTTHPGSQTKTVGQPVTFFVNFTGTPTPTLQWKFNGADIPGATEGAFTINNVQPQNAGLYSVVATNAADTVTSNAATLTVNIPPAFTFIPGDVTHNAGTAINWSAGVTGSPTPTMQWRRNGVAIPGATGSSFSIASLSPADAGTYSILASNVAGDLVSGSWTLTVNTPPVITQHPASQTINPGQPVTFTAAATGNPAPTFQWKFNGADIPGETGASYTINSVQPANAGLYSVAATNSVGSVISNAGTLTVNSPPVFTAHPASLTRNVTQPAFFSATATGTPTPTYQWKKDGVNIPGATNASFFIPAVFPGNAGTYTVVATNAAGSATSNAAILTVNIAPSFNSHPASQTKTVGQSVTFSASAYGVPDPAYQWRKNGADIAGATSASYTIPSVTLASAGNYDVVATNSAGSATSNPAVLTVNAAAVPPVFTLHPAGRNVISGQPVVFSAIATGDPTPTYQWRRNGVNIPGATGSSLAIAGASGDDAGTYTVVATNSAGSATSNPAVLTVSFVGTAATGHGIGDLPGGPFFSQVRDATKAGGVLYAVGSSSVNGSAFGDTAFLWSSTGGIIALPNLVTNTTGLSFITASAITPDAAFIASRARNAATGNSRTAVRVTRDGLVNLDLNNGAIPGQSAAVAISADGSILYGLANNLNQAVRFTAAGPTATLIPFPAPEHDRSGPAGRGTSSDGSVMVGTAATFAVTGGNSVGPGNVAFRYVHGIGVSAIPKPAGGTWNGAMAVSPDGNLTLVYGDSTAVPNGELYIHNATAGTLTQLGSPTPGWRPANFGGMSADGTIAVTSFGDPNGSQRASFMRNSHGWHDLRTVIAAKGIEVEGWSVDNALGISPDGTLVFGSGTHEGGVEGFVVEFAPGDLAAYQGEPPATTIAGTWSIGDTDGAESTIVVFNDEGTYFLIEDSSGGAGGNSVDSEGRPMASAVADAYGYETGTYTWDPATGAFTVTTLVDALGDSGLAGLNNVAGMTIRVLGGTLTLHVPGPDGGDYTLARATDESPITGAWVVGDPASEDALTVVVFLGDGTYYILSDGPDNDPSGQDGIEHGTYTWNPVTGALTTTVLFDSNGEWGLSDPDDALAVFVEGGALVVGAPGGPVVAVSTSIPAFVPPVINDQPEGRSVGTGQPVSFTIEAVGTAPFTYQWRKDGVNIAGATSATYSIASAQASDAATYSVVVTNPAGSETSNGAVLAVNAPPAIVAQPAAKAVVNGATVSFEVAAGGSNPIAYQWRRNGVPIPGANQPSLTLSSVTAANAGNYSVVVINAYGSVVSSAAALTVGSDSRLTNISTRALAGTGDATLVVGFYIAGTGSKTLIIRGVGPRLGDFIPGPVVTDPSITVYDSNQQVVATNNDWDPAIAPDFGVVGAFSLNPGSKDAALKLTLPTGLYTVHLVNPGAPAEAIIEVYDRSKDAGTRLVNLSCRMKIPQGQTVIVGTYLDGGPSNIVVRGVGPGIAPYLPEPDRPFVVTDPMLRFYNDADALTGENDDWDLATRPFFGPVGAFDLPDGSKDAAARLSIPAGRYSIHATGNSSGGTLLVELYQAP